MYFEMPHQSLTEMLFIIGFMTKMRFLEVFCNVKEQGGSIKEINVRNFIVTVYLVTLSCDRC